MFRIRHQSQIRRIIVGIIAICVMHQLMTLQGPAKNLRHYQAMFVNKTRLISHCIFRAIKPDTSLADLSIVWITFESITASPTSKRLQLVIIPTRNKAAFSAIWTRNFCTIYAVDLMKFLFRFHDRTSMPCPFEKSKTFFKEIYHPLRK